MSSTIRDFTEKGLLRYTVEEVTNREIKWLKRVIQKTVIGQAIIVMSYLPHAL